MRLSIINISSFLTIRARNLSTNLYKFNGLKDDGKQTNKTKKDETTISGSEDNNKTCKKIEEREEIICALQEEEVKPICALQEDEVKPICALQEELEHELLNNVKGLSEKVYKLNENIRCCVSKGDIGIYKAPEYYSYNKYTFNEAMVELRPYRFWEIDVKKKYF